MREKAVWLVTSCLSLTTYNIYLKAREESNLHRYAMSRLGYGYPCPKRTKQEKQIITIHHQTVAIQYLTQSLILPIMMVRELC